MQKGRHCYLVFGRFWPLVAESSAVCISMGLKSRCIFAKGRNAFRASVCNLYAVMSDKD